MAKPDGCILPQGGSIPPRMWIFDGSAPMKDPSAYSRPGCPIFSYGDEPDEVDGTCRTCGGSGSVDVGDCEEGVVAECPDCKGTGKNVFVN
jgi:hypothetical protein